VLCMSGWIFRGRATASATALFGPWPYSSFVRWSLRPLPYCHWSGLRLRMGALIIFVRYRRRSSSPSVVATGSVLDLPHLLRLGMGESPERNSVFHHNYGFVPMAAAPV
jgi:hypothetical protein